MTRNGTVLTHDAATGEAAARQAGRVEKPWGWELVFHNDGYSLKGLYVEPNSQSSWHRHLVKAESLLCVSGAGLILTTEEPPAFDMPEVTPIRPGEAFTIQAGLWHRIVNAGGDYLVLHEAGTQHREEDTERYEPGGRISDRRRV